VTALRPGDRVRFNVDVRMPSPSGAACGAEGTVVKYWQDIEVADVQVDGASRDEPITVAAKHLEIVEQKIGVVQVPPSLREWWAAMGKVIGKTRHDR
jgi:hypothetical protein